MTGNSLNTNDGKSSRLSRDEDKMFIQDIEYRPNTSTHSDWPAMLPFPFTTTMNFMPPGAPDDHPARRLHDDRGLIQNAPNGCWYMSVYDQDAPEEPVASAWFTRQGSDVQCEFLDVDLAYRGLGIPRHLCELANVLCGAEVRDIENVVDDMRNIGYQFYADNFPSDLLDANHLHEA